MIDSASSVVRLMLRRGEDAMDKKLKTKTFCKWDKGDIKKNSDGIYELTANPKYFCEKCARVSKLKGSVCKPHKFELNK